MARRRDIEAGVKAARAEAFAGALAIAKSSGGPNQTAVAQVLGVSPQQVSKLVIGKDLIDAPKAYMLSRALRCGFLDLFRAGRFELAEEPARFVGEGEVDGDSELDALFTAARGLSAPRRLILRDVILELLAAEET